MSVSPCERFRERLAEVLRGRPDPGGASGVWSDHLVDCAACRDLLADRLADAGLGDAFDHIRAQRGMFSYLGVSVEQVKRLREEFSIYMVDSSRINVAGVNQQNLDYLADALVAVSR